jgi:hypothetical protein
MSRVRLDMLLYMHIFLFTTQNFLFRSITVRTIHGRKIFSTWEKSEELIIRHKLDLTPAITHVFPLSQFEKVKQRAAERGQETPCRSHLQCITPYRHSRFYSPVTLARSFSIPALEPTSSGERGPRSPCSSFFGCVSAVSAHLLR